jgi:subtilisin family serine protease
VKRLALVFAFAAASAVYAEDVATRCQTEASTLTFANPAVPDAPTTIDIRRIVRCGDDLPDNALWHLDRLDSVDGKLDGHFIRSRATALVYVVDTGVEMTHDEFAEGNVIAGIDVARTFKPGVGGCENDDSATHPCIPPTPVGVNVATHGTGVASIIAGRNVGVAPGASLVAVRILSSVDSDWVTGMNAIIKHAWDPATPQVTTAVVNMSDQLAPLAGSNAASHALFEQKVRDMVFGVDAKGNRDANGKHFFFSVAAGNAAEPSKPGAARGQCGPNYEVALYPATLGKSIAGVVTVGGTTAENRMWDGSCRGDLVELFAPADHVLAACPTGRYDYRAFLDSGTSWSAPIVAGAAAWLLTIFPRLTPPEIESLLENTGSRIEEGGAAVTMVNSQPRRRGARH